jgi:TolA-binding protein
MRLSSKYFHLTLALTLALSLSGCLRTREEIAREQQEKEMQVSLQQNVVQTGQSVEQVQAEIGRLQGRIEEMEHRRQKEMAGLNSSKEGSEKALADIKGQLANLQQQQTALFEEIKKLKEDNLQLSKQLNERPKADATPRAQKKSAGKAGRYDPALKAYLAKDYDEAINGFRGFLELFPHGKKSASAHYYLGDSLYRKKDYQNAIVEFGTVQENERASTLGRMRSLRIVQSFMALGIENDAKAFAQLLIQSSPNSAEAKQAKKLVK